MVKCGGSGDPLKGGGPAKNTRKKQVDYFEMVQSKYNKLVEKKEVVWIFRIAFQS